MESLVCFAHCRAHTRSDLSAQIGSHTQDVRLHGLPKVESSMLDPHRYASILGVSLTTYAVVQHRRRPPRTTLLFRKTGYSEPGTLKFTTNLASDIVGPATVLLLLLIFDVISGARIVSIVDNSIHEWVTSSLSEMQRRDFNRLSNTFDDIAQFASWTAAGLLAVQKRSPVAVAMPIGFESVRAFARMLKQFVHRTRPSDILTDYSFPSAHTTRFSFCLIMLACVLVPRLTDKRGSISARDWFVAFVSALLMMGSTRVLADAHWFSDTLGGALAGAIFVGMGELLVVVAAALLNDMSKRRIEEDT